jgi:hypothetical protein
MSGPAKNVAVRLEDDRVAIEHDCNGRRNTATLNSADWRIVSAEPLTVEPSVHCGDCGLHGWITGGDFWTSSGSR